MHIEKVNECLMNPNMKEDEKADQIAKSMNESFQSQKENFDCITEECENLRKIMMSYGVYGCRLANNGWGGSLIGIAPLAKTNKIIEFLMNDFYMDPKNKAFVNDDLNMLVFQSNAGCSVKYIDPQFEIWF